MSEAALRERCGAATRLRRDLVGLADGFGKLLSHEERAWKSITFTGTRHIVRLRFEGAAAIAGGERLIAGLADHEFKLPGQLVAEAVIVAVRHHVAIDPPFMEIDAELLLLEEG